MKSTIVISIININNKERMKRLNVLAMLVLLPLLGTAQINGVSESGQTKNYISTGMPILLIAPDGSSSGLGDVGAATRPDAYSAHWNNAKFAFIEGTMGVGLTYTPWLRNLNVGDMNLLYLGGYYRINDRSTAAAGLTYFTLGTISMTDRDANHIMDIRPNEFAFDLTYALKLTDELALGASGRFIRSDLTQGQYINDDGGYTETHAANSLAADIGLYYTREIDKYQEFALGAHISNLGAKLSYSEDDTDKEFLPANLRVGGRYTNKIDNYNKVSVMLDFNKLLVPTPKYRNDTAQAEYYRIGVIPGALQSFADAPGGMTEELQEIQISAGVEYWYEDMIAARMGYFYEHANKGGRQYLTVGVGLRYSYFDFDFSYLVPTTTLSTNPLSHTIRISLGLNFIPEKE